MFIYFCFFSSGQKSLFYYLGQLANILKYGPYKFSFTPQISSQQQLKEKKKQINPCPVHPFTTFTILFLSEKLKRTSEHCSVPEKSVHTGYFRSKGEMPSEVPRASLLLYQKSASSSFLMD